jgi:hypothetical protein
MIQQQIFALLRKKEAELSRQISDQQRQNNIEENKEESGPREESTTKRATKRTTKRPVRNPRRMQGTTEPKNVKFTAKLVPPCSSRIVVHFYDDYDATTAETVLAKPRANKDGKNELVYVAKLIPFTMPSGDKYFASPAAFKVFNTIIEQQMAQRVLPPLTTFNIFINIDMVQFREGSDPNDIALALSSVSQGSGFKYGNVKDRLSLLKLACEQPELKSLSADSVVSVFPNKTTKEFEVEIASLASPEDLAARILQFVGAPVSSAVAIKTFADHVAPVFCVNPQINRLEFADCNIRMVQKKKDFTGHQMERAYNGNVIMSYLNGYYPMFNGACSYLTGRAGGKNDTGNVVPALSVASTVNSTVAIGFIGEPPLIKPSAEKFATPLETKAIVMPTVPRIIDKDYYIFFSEKKLIKFLKEARKNLQKFMRVRKFKKKVKDMRTLRCSDAEKLSVGEMDALIKKLIAENGIYTAEELRQQQIANLGDDSDDSYDSDDEEKKEDDDKDVFDNEDAYTVKQSPTNDLKIIVRTPKSKRNPAKKRKREVDASEANKKPKSN